MAGAAIKSLRRLSRYVAIGVLTIVVLIGAALGATQTGWFKNWLRRQAVSQTARFLNGTLEIDRLSGSVLSGLVLDGVTLRHEGQAAVSIRKLTVKYNPLTMISEGVILDSLILEQPTVLFERNDRGWNFNRFVKTRQNTGGRGSPPITMRSIVVRQGHVIVKDRDRLLEEVMPLDVKLRFAYLKPGIQVEISELSGRSGTMNVHNMAGGLTFDRGAIHIRRFAVETDRTRLVTTVDVGAARATGGRTLDIDLHAPVLSLPEVGRYFKPLANITIEPAVDVRGSGTIDEFLMDVNVVSSTGNAKGPLVGHFGKAPGIEGKLQVTNVNMAPILHRKEWETRVTGEARFIWAFPRGTGTPSAEPMKVNFGFTGPRAEGFGYVAADVRAHGVYDSTLLRFDASAASYGATATTRAEFRFATPGRPLAYRLGGRFQNLDLRRLPPFLSVPPLESVTGGEYLFEADGRTWRGSGSLEDAVVEGARFSDGTVVEMDSGNGVLHYSASGSVRGLNPRRFAVPIEADWLDDERFSGTVAAKFTFDGSGRRISELNLHTIASLVDSDVAGAHFPTADIDFTFANRHMTAKFAGPFEHVPGSLFISRPEFADTSLNGIANATVGLSIPETGPVAFDTVDGTATLAMSSIAGLPVESGQVAAAFENSTIDVKSLTLSGPQVRLEADGTLAMGDTGQSNLRYDLSFTDLHPLAAHFNQVLSGAARLAGQATGPASQLTIAGTLDSNRLQYGTNVDAMTARSQYTIELPDFDLERARVRAENSGTFVTIAGVNFLRIAAQTTYQSHQLEFTSSFEEQTRSLGLGGAIVFHPDHDELHMRALTLAVGPTQWTLRTGTEATVRYSTNAVTVAGLVLQRGVQTLTANGTVAIGSDSSNLANDLNIRFDNVQVQDVNELLLGERPLAGLLNASADIRGTRNNPRLQADFALTGGSVQGVQFNSLVGKANYSGQAVDVDVRLEQTPAAVLTALGTVPVPAGPGVKARTAEFDLAVKSTAIDLGLFQAATTRLSEMTGKVQADLQVGGTIEAPRLNGQVEAIDAGFTVVDTSVTYAHALGRLIFEGDQLVVDRFQVSDTDGDQLVAIGQLGIVRRSLGAMNVQLSAHEFKVLDNVFGHVEIDADVRLAGDAAQPQISGVVSSPNARIEVDQLLEQLTKNAYSTQPTIATSAETPGTVDADQGAGSGAAPGSLYSASTIDIRVRLPDDLVLRGRDMQASFSRVGLGDMNITVGGELQIRKAPGAAAGVVGTVTVIRGFYDFQGRRFEVLRDSQIRFDGTDRLDPSLQVGAQRIISGVTAIVNIRGTARQPSVTLSSSPPMDEADVLSLIVFNQPINQLGESQRLNLVERAGTLAAGYLTTPLANSIANALDLDLFEIRAAGGINGEPSVALGQQFGSRLFVSFRQDFGSADRSELTFEYRINELLRLVSTVTQGGQQTHRTQRIDTTGGDLIFVISY